MFDLRKCGIWTGKSPKGQKPRTSELPLCYRSKRYLRTSLFALPVYICRSSLRQNVDKMPFLTLSAHIGVGGPVPILYGWPIHVKHLVESFVINKSLFRSSALIMKWGIYGVLNYFRYWEHGRYKKGLIIRKTQSRLLSAWAVNDPLLTNLNQGIITIWNTLNILYRMIHYSAFV